MLKDRLPGWRTVRAPMTPIGEDSGGRDGSAGRDDRIRQEPVKLGIPGLSVPQGTHLCGFFRGREERGDIVFPYLHEGLRSGDKCLCAFEATNRDALRDEVSVRVDVASASEQLDIVLSSDIYSAQGDFSVPDMLSYWDAWATNALVGGGFTAARAVGEMTWAVTEVIGADNLIHYECELNRFVPRYPQVLLCLYDLDRFCGDLLVDIMKTHPKVLMGATVLENLYYVPPDEWAATRR